MLRLNEIIKERGLTQEDVAKMTGVPQSTISRWCANKIDSYKNVIIDALCDKLEIEPGDLIVRIKKSD